MNQMNERETALYRAARNVPLDRILNAGRQVMVSDASMRFRARNEALMAQIAMADPVQEAMRNAIAKSSDFASVRTAVAAARKRPERSVIRPLFVPAAPKAARLKLGSVHMVDTPPFQAMNWQEISVFGGPNDVGVPLPVADGGTGNMNFQIFGGGRNVQNNSSVSCWAAIGQTYVIPDGVLEIGGSAFLRFSASPSFMWNTGWLSDFWRLASGRVWIGQRVDMFNQDGAFVATPVANEINLFSFSDQNLVDGGNQDGSNTSFGIQSFVFVQPQFFYNCWVWAGADAYGDQIDTGFSWSSVGLSANVSALVFDTL